MRFSMAHRQATTGLNGFSTSPCYTTQVGHLGLDSSLRYRVYAVSHSGPAGADYQCRRRHDDDTDYHATHYWHDLRPLCADDREGPERAARGQSPGLVSRRLGEG